MDDLEHRSHRANLILNIQEDSKNGPPIVKFISDLLMEVMGVVVFGSSLSWPKTPERTAAPFLFGMLLPFPGDRKGFVAIPDARCGVQRFQTEDPPGHVCGPGGEMRSLSKRQAASSDYGEKLGRLLSQQLRAKSSSQLISTIRKTPQELTIDLQEVKQHYLRTLLL